MKVVFLIFHLHALMGTFWWESGVYKGSYHWRRR